MMYRVYVWLIYTAINNKNGITRNPQNMTQQILKSNLQYQHRFWVPSILTYFRSFIGSIITLWNAIACIIHSNAVTRMTLKLESTTMWSSILPGCCKVTQMKFHWTISLTYSHSIANIQTLTLNDWCCSRRSRCCGRCCKSLFEIFL